MGVEKEVDALGAALPGVPQVACFDTAFHRSQPELAQLFALPRAITAEGVRRYGFHGLSYEYIAEALPGLVGNERARGGRAGGRARDLRDDGGAQAFLCATCVGYGMPSCCSRSR